MPGLVREFGPYQRWTVPVLLVVANNASLPEEERLNARLALVPTGQENPETLIDPLLAAPPEAFRAMLGMLSPLRR